MASNERGQATDRSTPPTGPRIGAHSETATDRQRRERDAVRRAGIQAARRATVHPIAGILQRSKVYRPVNPEKEPRVQAILQSGFGAYILVVLAIVFGITIVAVILAVTGFSVAMGTLAALFGR
ncbi:MAG: hypothetical protein AAF638_12750 [Pseudomonadota bacterium]